MRDKGLTKRICWCSCCTELVGIS